MKKIKFLFILIVSIFTVSLVSAQGYVDDLYYNKKSKAEREAAMKKANEEAKQAAQARRVSQTTTQSEDSFDDSEYYPGMFADAVNGTQENASKASNGKQRSNSDVTIQIAWSPSWYGYGAWGSPFYNPWGYSGFYDPFDPFYSYGWGWNSYWGWNGWNGWNNWGYPSYGWGWNHPHYHYGYHGHYGYYEQPRYNRYNSTIGNGRRDGNIMVGTYNRTNMNGGSGRGGNYTITNEIRRMDNTTRNNSINRNNNRDYNRGTVVNNGNPSQYNRGTTTVNTTNRQSGTSVGTGSNSGGSYQRGNAGGSGSSGGSGGSGGTVVHTRRR